MSDLDAAVRLWVYEQTARSGAVPGPTAIGDRFSLPPAAMAESLRRLEHEHDALVLLPGSSLIWMAEPFSAVPTDFRVVSGDDSWWANCIWDGLAILALLDRDGQVETHCPASGAELTVSISDGALRAADHVVHFAVAARDWWRSIGFT